MKLTAFILLSASLAVSAAGHSQRVTLSLKDAPLKTVFFELNRQTGYNFLYNDEALAAAKNVTIKVKDAVLADVLSLCFKDQPLDYTIENNAIVVKARVAQVGHSGLDPESFSQLPPPIDISGKVTDMDGNPLIGATVKVKGSNKGTTTGNDGVFVLKGVDENATLEISFVGYEMYTVAVNNKNTIVASLKLKPESLNEVVINKGYYTEKRTLATGNVSTVKSADIERQPVNSPMLALQGRVAGLIVSQSNGIPGGAIKVEIRGRNTISQGRDPLYIVDGVPFTSVSYVSTSNGGLGSSILGGLGINPLNMIDPSDIESIEILKDADATAIYGSRAANGVVLITTKKGKLGPIKANIDLQTGFGKITRKANLMNTEQYLEMRREAFKNDGLTPSSDPNASGINSYAPDLTIWDTTRYTDWQKIMIGGTAKFINAQSSIEGGNEYMQYFFGGGYRKETTVFPGDWNDQKGSVHFNLASKSVNQKFKVELSGTYLADNTNLPQVDFTQFITIAPNAPSLYNNNGSLDWANFSDNPFRRKFLQYRAKTSELVANSIISYKLARGLIFKTSIGYTNLQINEATATPIAYFNPASNVTSGSASFNNNAIKSWVVEPQLNYGTNFGKVHFDGLLGSTVQRRGTEGQIVTGNGYTNDALLNSLAAATTISKGNSVYEQYRYVSLFSRVGFNWEEKYVVNITGRRDGSSRFGPGKQFGNFGALGAAWVFSKESFMKPLSEIINYGKIRASYGTSGNEPANNYAYLELYNFRTGNPYGGGGGIFPNNLPVPGFSWEINKKKEIGLELGLLGNRLNIGGSYYKNRCSNQLVSFPLPNVSGFSSVVANLPATVENTSLELTVSTINVKVKSFEWSSSINITEPKNKLVAFPHIEINPGYLQLYSIGQPLSSVKVYNFAGVDPVTGTYQFYDTKGNFTFNPVFLVDNNKHVNTTPKFYGGFLNEFNYRNIQVNVDLQFVKQTGYNFLFRSNPPGYASGGQGTWNQPVDLLNRWRKPNDIVPYEKFTTDYPQSWDYVTASDAAYSDASFVRVKNVSISYKLADEIVRRLKIERVRIYLQAQNILTFTKYKGADPETQSITVLPPLRVFTCGIQITL